MAGDGGIPLPPGAARTTDPKPHLGGGEPRSLPKEEGGGKLVLKECPCYALTCLRALYNT